MRLRLGVLGVRVAMFFRALYDRVSGRTAARAAEWQRTVELAERLEAGRRFRRSQGAKKGWETRRAKMTVRAGAADGNQAGSDVSDSFTPDPGQSTREPYFDHESDAVQEIR